MRLKDNWYQRVVHILTGLVFIAMWVHIILVWGDLPDRIPTHYDFAGEVDGWGSKASILLLPVIGTVMLPLLIAVEFFPQTWNTGVQVTPLNQVFVYRTTKSMLVTLELTLLLTFAIINVFTVRATSVPIWLLPVTMLLDLAPVAFFLIRLFVGSKKYRI